MQLLFGFSLLVDSLVAGYHCLEEFLSQRSASDLPTQQEDCYSVRFPEQPKQKRQYVICISEWDFVEILHEKIYENKTLQSLPLKRVCVLFFSPILYSFERKHN